MNAPAQNIRYAPAGPIIKAFHESQAFVRGIMGPIGSGKSTACVLEILIRSMLQARSPDGKRKSRWAIIRNSYPELRTTTLKTWQEWCPAQYGRLTMDSPIRHHVQSGDLDMEILFLALDRDEDVRKLLSLELTGAWLNEVREIPKTIADALTGRVGRYPSKNQGGCTWSGIVMDTNPPDDQSWYYRLAEEETPHGWEFFHQPAGDSPEGENLLNLPPDYYARLKPGKDEEWITVYVKGQYGYLIEGKPVYPMYRDRTHTAQEPIQALPHLPILVGADYGLTPAAVFGQRLIDGRWRILDELCTEDCGITRFAEKLVTYAASQWPDHALVIPDIIEDSHPIQGWGDPAGDYRDGDERTAHDVLRLITNWPWKAAPSNEPVMRREVVIAALNRMIDGHPGFLLSPNCKMLRKGFNSGYHFKFIRTANGSSPQVHETPQKNEYSHPHDALQYLFLGSGEQNIVLGKQNRNKAGKARMAKDINYDLFG